MRFDYIEYVDRNSINYMGLFYWCDTCTSIAEFVKMWEDRYSVLTIKCLNYEGIEYYV